MHQNQVESLKSKLKDYNVDHLGNGPTIHMSSGQEIDTSIQQGLLRASELGDEKYLLDICKGTVNFSYLKFEDSIKSLFNLIKI